MRGFSKIDIPKEVTPQSQNFPNKNTKVIIISLSYMFPFFSLRNPPFQSLKSILVPNRRKQKRNLIIILIIIVLTDIITIILTGIIIVLT